MMFAVHKLLLLAVLAATAPAETRLVIDEDFTTGHCLAERTQQPGEFTTEGWRVAAEYTQMKWDLGRFYPRGRVEVMVRGPLDQEPKRTVFAAWNEEAAVDGDRLTQAFFQLRLMDHGMMLRLSHRPGGRSFEGRTPALAWEDRWYKIEGAWDTAGGVNSLWRDGELLREGRFNAPFSGFRWVFIGQDNYQRQLSVPGMVYRSLKVWVEGEGGEGPPPRYFFPPPGEELANQRRQAPADAGLDSEVIRRLEPVAKRWALWRNGLLIHRKGDFNESSDVASNRKTWHAAAVGAAILQGKIPSIDQKISVWNPELKGKHADAAWRHVMTQTSGFDYPYGDQPAYGPGEIWTYSDWNPVNLCRALARVYSKRDYHDDYESVMRAAYFDAIGLRGWRTLIRKDAGFPEPDDGVRFVFDLEDMGRLGLLMVASGNWDGRQLIPSWFVNQLEKKQTAGIPANYAGPNDGKIGLDPERFPEAPYGFMTWTNSGKDAFPRADPGWAYASGAGGHRIYWNRRLGIVFASAGGEKLPSDRSVPHLIEAALR